MEKERDSTGQNDSNSCHGLYGTIRPCLCAATNSGSNTLTKIGKRTNGLQSIDSCCCLVSYFGGDGGEFLLEIAGGT